MNEVLVIVLFTGMLIAGLKKAAENGYILHWLNVWSEKHLPKYLDTIFIGCVTCMSSLWSVIVFSTYKATGGALSWFWLLFIIPAVAFLSTFLYSIISTDD